MNSKTDSLADSVEEAVPNHTLWDRLGIAGSILCVIHCAATPLLIGYLSAFGLSILGDELIHQALAILLLVIALLAFIPGFKNHKNPVVLAVGALGVTLLLITSFVLGHHVAWAIEIGLTVTGSLLLVGAHTANWRLTDRHSECSTH